MRLQIRPVREQDIAELVRLARAIWYVHYPTIITVEQIEYVLDKRYRPDVICDPIQSAQHW